VDGICRLLESGETAPVNLGNPQEFSVIEFARLVKELTATTSEIVFLPLPKDDPTRRCPDISYARSRLGWEPRVPLREGLTRTIEWFRSARTRTS
ncbi:MAG: SDR family NAD-dependent epimerase/dehydratase, partial [candidate division WOR-3 bacterium]